jgi:hypothetical protein
MGCGPTLTVLFYSSCLFQVGRTWQTPLFLFYFSNFSYLIDGFLILSKSFYDVYERISSGIEIRIVWTGISLNNRIITTSFGNRE